MCTLQLLLGTEAHKGRHRRPARRVVAIGCSRTLEGGRLPPRTLVGVRLVGERRLPPRSLVGGRRLPPRPPLERQLATNNAAVHACNAGGRGVGVGKGGLGGGWRGDTLGVRKVGRLVGEWVGERGGWGGCWREGRRDDGGAGCRGGGEGRLGSSLTLWRELASSHRLLVNDEARIPQCGVFGRRRLPRRWSRHAPAVCPRDATPVCSRIHARAGLSEAWRSGSACRT